MPEQLLNEEIGSVRRRSAKVPTENEHIEKRVQMESSQRRKQLFHSPSYSALPSPEMRCSTARGLTDGQVQSNGIVDFEEELVEAKN